MALQPKHVMMASVFAAAALMAPASISAISAQTTASVSRATTSTATADRASSLPATAVPATRSKEKFQTRHKEILERIKQGPIELVFLGDSITDRWSEAPDIWNENFGKWKAANFGIGGDRTENVLWRLNNGEFEGVTPKVVVLMIGTNNTHSNSPEDIVFGIRKIIDTIHEKSPETEVLLLAVFPRRARMRDGKLYTMPTEKVKAINKLLPELAEDDKVRFLDIGDHFLLDGEIPKDVMPDGVHLSKKGYQIWAEQVTPVLKEMMQ